MLTSNCLYDWDDFMLGWVRLGSIELEILGEVKILSSYIILLKYENIGFVYLQYNIDFHPLVVYAALIH